jgi:hypothetical protein
MLLERPRVSRGADLSRLGYRARVGLQDRSKPGSSNVRVLTPGDVEIHRLFTFAASLIGKAVAALLANPTRRETEAVFVFNGWDEQSVLVYEEAAAISRGSLADALEPGNILVVGCTYSVMLVLLARHYDLSEYEEPALKPNHVRVILFAGGQVSLKQVGVSELTVPAGVMIGPVGDA